MPSNGFYSRSKRFGRKLNRAYYDAGNYHKRFVANLMAPKVIKQLSNKLGLNTEKKFFDVKNNATVVNAYQQADLTPIPQGDGQSERIGCNIRVVSSLCRLQCSHNAAGSPTQKVRVLLVRALSTSQTPTEVLDGTIASEPVTLFPRNLDFSKSYKVIWDKTLSVATGESTSVEVGLYRKLNHEIGYVADASTAAERNSYFLMFAADVSTNGPTLWYHHRVRYVDN